MTALPTLFGDDVVDNVDSVMAEHVNNLRAWHLAASGLALNSLSSALTTDVTLSDTDAPVQFYDCGGAARNVFLPAESTDNHPFYIGNTSTDTSTVTVMDDSGVTTIAEIAQDYAGLFISDGAAWRAVSGGGGGGSSTVGTNYLINGGFSFAQRQAPGTLTTIATDKYSADRWRTSSQSASLQYIRADGNAEAGLTSKYFGTYKQITNAGKFMVYQITENIDSIPLRGKTVTFQAQMKASSAKTIRMAVIELQNAGTADTIPSTFVAAWGANTVDPTLGANLAVITGAQSKSITTSMATFSVTVTVPSNSKNIICAIWTDSQFSANDTLSIAEAGLYVSDAEQAWTPRPIAQELALCQRYYEKSIGVDVAPVNGVAFASTLLMQFLCTSTTETSTTFKFVTPKFSSPELTFYRTDINATGDGLFDMLYGAAWHDNTTTGGAVVKNQTGFSMSANDTAASLTAGYVYAVAGVWTAEAEL